MKKNKIYLMNNNNSIILDGKEIQLFSEVYKSLYKNRSIVVLNEVLYVKKIDNKSHIDIQKLIRDSFGDNDDYLFHYFYINHNKEIVMYAIKCGNNVRLLSKDTYDLEVRPIQIIIVDEFCKYIKASNWSLIFKFKNMYYFIKCKEEVIEITFVEEDLVKIKDKIVSSAIDNLVYYSKNIEDLTHVDYSEIQFVAMDIGELLSEKRLFKEGIFTGSICSKLYKKTGEK